MYCLFRFGGCVYLSVNLLVEGLFVCCFELCVIRYCLFVVVRVGLGICVMLRYVLFWFVLLSVLQMLFAFGLYVCVMMFAVLFQLIVWRLFGFLVDFGLCVWSEVGCFGCWTFRC